MISKPRLYHFRKELAFWLQWVSQKVSPPDFVREPDSPAVEVDENFGEIIFHSGWRQGSFFPIEEMKWPQKDLGSKKDAYAIICSQSCAVVSRNMKRDPYAEIIIGYPLQGKYNPRSQEATGKDQGRLFLKIDGVKGVDALVVSINHRFEMPRESLVAHKPLVEVKLAEGEAKKLTNWLARNYLRIALPDALVDLLKLHIFPQLEKWLKRELSASVTINSEVDMVYVAWDPDQEVKNYQFDMLVLTKNGDIQKDFELTLKPTILHLMKDNQTGLLLKFCECQLKGETMLSDLDGYSRFSQYDYMTSATDWQQLLDPKE